MNADSTELVFSYDRDGNQVMVVDANGSPVELVNHEGMIHAFWSLGRAIFEASRSIDRAALALRAALESPHTQPEAG